jgi:hypothetical protein
MTLIETEGRDLQIASSTIPWEIFLQMNTLFVDDVRVLIGNSGSVYQWLEDNSIGYVNFPGSYTLESGVYLVLANGYKFCVFNGISEVRFLPKYRFAWIINKPQIFVAHSPLQ